MIQGNILPTKLLCKEVVKEKVSKGGILLPGTSRDPEIVGEVLQIGSSPLIEIKVGERVIFYPSSAQRFEIDGNPFMLVENRDVLFHYYQQ